MKLLYEGSVKNVYLSDSDPQTLVFDFTDDYSVFDWGKMPDSIPGKGAALASLSSYFFKRLRDAQEWSRFFERNPALIEKASKVHQNIAKQLMALGLKTHFKSRVNETQITVDRVHVSPPTSKILANGTEFFEYRMGSFDRSGELIPLEVVFRHALTDHSSALTRYPEKNLKAGQIFETPFLECFTKLEPTDRFLALSEAPVVGRISVARFENMLIHTHFISLILKSWFSKKNIQLIDGKLEWAIARQGELMLVDSIGPDELRLEQNGVLMSKESLRTFYRETSWYEEIVQAKIDALASGQTDWKKKVKSSPPKIPEYLLKSVSEMYQKLADLMMEVQ